MKLKRTLILCSILFLFVITSCGLGDLLSQAKRSLRDLTDSATNLMDRSTSMLADIERRVQNEQLADDVGDMANDIISSLMNDLGEVLDKNGGLLFDHLNGSVDNIFARISQLLNQINEDILKKTAITLLQTISYEIREQITYLTASVEDIITIVAGNVFIFLDKVVNSLVILLSIILLAIGLIVFTVILLLKKDDLKIPTIIGLSFAGLYIIFFTLVIFVSPLRGYIIAGFNFAETATTIEAEPSVRLCVPETFILGNDNKIVLYGSNLHKLENPKVKLFSGSTVKKIFNDANVFVTRSKIVITGLKGSSGWILPTFSVYKARVINTIADLSELKYTSFIKDSYATIDKDIISKISFDIPRTISMVSGGTRAATSLAGISAAVIKPVIFDNEVIASATLSPVILNSLKVKTFDFFKGIYVLNPTSYLIKVFAGDTEVPSAQYIEMKYPDPPPPKPDIQPLDISWTTQAAVDSANRLRVRFMIKNPEAIKNSFYVRITPIDPAGSEKRLTVTTADLLAANNGIVSVLSSAFIPGRSGTNKFEVYADYSNTVAELNEGNNKKEFSLHVSSYLYDVKISGINMQLKPALQSMVKYLDPSGQKLHLAALRNGGSQQTMYMSVSSGAKGGQLQLSGFNEGDQLLIQTGGSLHFKVIFVKLIQTVSTFRNWRMDNTLIGSGTSTKSTAFTLNIGNWYSVSGTIKVTGRIVN